MAPGAPAPLRGTGTLPARNLGRLFRDALPPALLNAAMAEADRIAGVEENYWMPRSDVLRACHATPAQPAGDLAVAEMVAAALYERVLRPHGLLGEDSGWSGAEWWAQTYETPGDGLAFHFDKDEAAMAERGEMRTPLVSCVVYLAEEGEGKPRLGATMVLDQAYDHEAEAAVPETSARCVLVWPSLGNVLVFDGNLAHGVTDSANLEDTRRTLLVNWWAERPENVPRPASDVLRSQGMATTRKRDVHWLREGREAAEVSVAAMDVGKSYPPSVALLFASAAETCGVDIDRVAAVRVDHAGWNPVMIESPDGKTIPLALMPAEAPCP